MSQQRVRQVRGRGVYLRGEDVDTDRIIPARFLKCVTFDGLGDALFFDERFGADGEPRPHPLNDPRHQGATILVTGSNFGCGSSREHAPQSIYRAGFRAVLAVSFAEIFFGNSTTLGMPCVSAAAEVVAEVGERIERAPATELALDLETMSLALDGDRYDLSMPEGTRRALLDGRWDPLGELLENDAPIAATAARLPYLAD